MLRDEIKSIKATTAEARKFGLTIGAMLLAVAGFLFWKQRPAFPALALAGAGFVLAGLIVPMLLKPVYKTWMSFAAVMGFIMTRVVLTVIFFGLFTPAALIARLLRRDLLEQRWDKAASTYWVKRPAAPFDPQSAERMF